MLRHGRARSPRSMRRYIAHRTSTRPRSRVDPDCEPRRRLELRAWFPLVSNFMKQETHAEIREIGLRGQGNFPRRHYPDRVLGYFLSPIQLEHPCFNNPIETLPDPIWQVCRSGPEFDAHAANSLALANFEAAN